MITETLAVGGPVDVVYDPMTPRRAKPQASIAPDRSDGEHVLVTAIVALMVLIALPPRMLQVRRVRRW